MKYSKVYLDSIGYELPPTVVTSSDLEARLKPILSRLRIADGQLAALTGILERRWWDQGHSLTEGAIAAARRALIGSGVDPDDLEVLIYGGVCRENFEPATACGVAAGLGVGENATIYDVSNACLGVLNGIIDVANRIELGQIKAGLVVSCETAREINEITIQKLLKESSDMATFTASIATLTGGSGAVAVLLTDGTFSTNRKHRLLGGVTHAAPQHHNLCRWGIRPAALNALAINAFTQFMTTDAVSVLKFGVELGLRTFNLFLKELGWKRDQIDKVICHQVGASHSDAILRTLGIPREKDFATYEFLGNIGTVSLPITAALAHERDFLQPGDRVGFLGIGSGLNCLMLGLEW